MPARSRLAIAVAVGMAVTGCRRGGSGGDDPHVQPGPGVGPVRAMTRDAGSAAGPTWYRATIRTPAGIEAYFFLGVPPAGTPGDATIRVGSHEVRTAAQFDGSTLIAPFPVHLTAMEATVKPDGTLLGTFSSSTKVWGGSALSLTATPVEVPVASALATVGGTLPALDLGANHSIWRVSIPAAGMAKLVINQFAPGELEALVFLDSGMILYLAGNGRGDTAVLTGFDGTSGYRLELAFDRDRRHAKLTLYQGHRLDYRETGTADRANDFELALLPHVGGKIELPELPALAGLPAGPTMIEMGGSWCSSCRNAAPFMLELYREYQARGLHGLTLLYEFSDDATADARQVQRFKDTYGVPWPVVAVPGSLDDFGQYMPTGLTDLTPEGFPILLFVGADHALVAYHVGFPASDSEAFPAVAAELRGDLEKLLKK